jgi:septal ring factor EnvC (AmiA/AmiB activator)
MRFCQQANKRLFQNQTYSSNKRIQKLRNQVTTLEVDLHKSRHILSKVKYSIQLNEKDEEIINEQTDKHRELYTKYNNEAIQYLIEKQKSINKTITSMYQMKGSDRSYVIIHNLIKELEKILDELDQKVEKLRNADKNPTEYLHRYRD